MLECRVILMAKAPIPGYVKTRLTDVLTAEQAAIFYSCCIQDIADCVKAAGLVLHAAITPVDSSTIFEQLLPYSVDLFQQEGESLGERMAHAISRINTSWKSSVLVIGGDIPSMQPSHLREAVTALDKYDVCLGPVEDGGYYLIGMNCPEDVFAGINWGSGQVLADTLKRANSLGLKVHLLPQLSDIDHYEDLVKLSDQLSEQFNCLEFNPWRTRECLKLLLP